MFFDKQSTCVVGPDDDVHMARVSNLLDYEGELAVAIGTRCRHVPEDRAHEVIAGHTITNDLSVRDWQPNPRESTAKSEDLRVGGAELQCRGLQGFPSAEWISPIIRVGEVPGSNPGAPM